MSGILRTFIRLPLYQKLMLSEAVILSAYYRFRTLYRPFAKLSAKIGTVGYETPKAVTDRRMVWTVHTIVEAVCKHTPWESKCLVRALTAKRMLNRRGHGCTLYMGVRQVGNEMDAHAWLRCGDMYVTGGNGTGYAVTGIFGDNDNTQGDKNGKQ